MLKDVTTSSAPATPKERKPRTRRPPNPSAVLVTGKEAERQYGPPYRSLYDLHIKGVLPAVQFPGSRRLWFRRSDIEQLIKTSVTSPETATA
jgi:hypothetical protein